MPTTGIYIIASQIKPDKFYIGSAIDIHSRWARHLSELRKGKHCNRHMQHHFNKYGEDDFTFEIVEECHPFKLLPFEQYWIDQTQPSFNICANAGSRFGVVCEFATREKIKRSWKNRMPISMQSRLYKKK